MNQRSVLAFDWSVEPTRFDEAEASNSAEGERVGSGRAGRLDTRRRHQVYRNHTVVYIQTMPSCENVCRTGNVLGTMAEESMVKNSAVPASAAISLESSGSRNGDEGPIARISD